MQSQAKMDDWQDKRINLTKNNKKLDDSNFYGINVLHSMQYISFAVLQCVIEKGNEDSSAPPQCNHHGAEHRNPAPQQCMCVSAVYLRGILPPRAAVRLPCNIGSYHAYRFQVGGNIWRIIRTGCSGTRRKAHMSIIRTGSTTSMPRIRSD